jgi:RND superfamily putative drug exporter
MSVADSITVAINTSGRAVLFAGLTVCVAILGLCALGVSFLYGVAVGTSISVALTMIASLTLLPAVLALLGYRVLPRKIRKAVQAGTYVAPVRQTRWSWWAQVVASKRLVLGTVAAAIIVVLAIPFFSMRLGHADASTDPTSTTTRRGYDLISNAFGKGYNSTLELVASGPTATNPTYLAGLASQLSKVQYVDPSSIHPLPLGKDLAFVTFKTTTSPQDAKTTQLVKTLRSDIVPGMEQGSANHVYVFGQTAILVDFAKVLSAKIPLFFVAIIGLSFLLLMVAFRSVLIPATAAVMNLFAAGASFGIVVAIFQWGWLSNLLGIGSGGPIDAFLPVLFFAILFGLSMDYQVFLVSRMHEEWVHTGDNERAVRVGQTETGGIITIAALIMMAVFGSFLLGNERTIKLVGIGLGGAIFLDAFILRTVLVPALMHQFGKANWYFPKWLDRITPRVSVEPDDDSWQSAAGDHPDGDKELAKV